jgi:C4-dicarboxylate-specific signal transduction histidine kinase
MQDISLHILDVAENSISADATKIVITVTENAKEDKLIVEITDNGRGMDKDMVKKARDPFFTSKQGKRVGLGIPLLAQAAREGGGTFDIASKPNSGTTLVATFALSHPDRKPLGDMEGTVRMLQLSHPDITLTYDYICK